MLDLSVIILTYNEKLHIRRCIENVLQISQEVFVVDSCSTDETVEICQDLGVKVVQHKWPGNQAEQFNWALDNLGITTKWVLRIDADEYLLPELITEISEKLSVIDDDVSGIVMKRRNIFMGQWLKRGIYPVKLLRLFRYGRGRSEQRLMDEHIIVSSGKIIEFENDFVDHNLGNLSYFCSKHIGYAQREAAEMLDMEYSISTGSKNFDNLSMQSSEKRKAKMKYATYPIFFRAIFYFVYRYILKCAFLEGKRAFIFCFFQALWYRMLVDAIIFEVKINAGNSSENIKKYLLEQYNITL